MTPPTQEQGALFATLGGKFSNDPVVVKDSFLRGSPTISQKVVVVGKQLAFLLIVV